MLRLAAQAGHDEALAPYVLGRAIRHQIFGEPAAALDALDSFPDDRLIGDWAAQVWMIRATNLMLLGRSADAVTVRAPAAMPTGSIRLIRVGIGRVIGTVLVAVVIAYAAHQWF